jgi:hypothetical protein
VRAVACGVALGLLAACEPSPIGKIHQPVEAPPPRHPAMAEAVVPGLPASAGGAQRGSLPPGHPPLESREGTGAPAGEPGGESGAALPSRGRVSVGPVSFEIPEGLVRQPPSMSMRLAQFALPRVEGDGEDGLMTLSTAAGGLQMNIQRWSQQFREAPLPQVEEIDSSGKKVTLVRMEGTFLGMGGAGAKSGFRLWGAMVETGGGQLMFFKATGPKATLERWDPALAAMAKSIQAP